MSLHELPIKDFDLEKHSKEAHEKFWNKIQAAIQESFIAITVGGYAKFVKEHKRYLPKHDVTDEWKEFVKIASQDIVQIVAECLRLRARIESNIHTDGNLLFQLVFEEEKKK